MDAPPARSAPLTKRPARHTWAGHLPRYSLAGVTVALVTGCASFTPSLLPRSWLLQGVVDGFSAAVGYALGVALAWLVRRVLRRTPGPRLTRRLWLLVGVVSVPLLAWATWWGQRWQREVHLLMGERPPHSYERVRILLLTALVAAALIAVARALRWLVRRTTGRLSRVVPNRLAQPLATLVVLLLVVGVNNEVLWRAVKGAAESAFGAVNQSTSSGTVRPRAPERSGSPSSLVPWDTLGRQGRNFVAHAPTLAQLSAFSGTPAQRPVRAYVGLRSAPSTAARAALAVRELRRAGGFDRAVLVVANTTGTGYVDPASVEPLEYMYHGDTAVVAIQYSYLPSALSFLVDLPKAQAAGRELFDAVHAAWSALPGRHRPKLLVTGVSLGVFGGEAPFRGVGDLRSRTDGAVFAGAPNTSPLHRRLVRSRDPGSPERMPVYDGGRAVRFAAAPGDLRTPATPWRRPRVVYLQNGSDPIVFWSPRLAFAKPDWLAEPRAPDVSPGMSWIPVVTFWQVTADLPFALDAPAGHGHSYRDIFVDAWAAVAPPPGWSAADTVRLRGLIIGSW